ncbi:MAG TPA: GNAT family N-acetyltransferase [Xanthobacteraceae bacterium]|nr:GNAT family N-acetyltransferase [Xanthobacteraceae bacterium]
MSDAEARSLPARRNLSDRAGTGLSGEREQRFDVAVVHDVGGIVRALHATPYAATVFQAERWIAAWYATIGPTVGAPRIVTVFDRHRLVAVLPLVRRRQRALRIIEFADQGVSDSNAPLLGPAAPASAADARLMWDAVCAALDADVVRLRKMPPQIEGRANPLALLPAARLSALPGNVLVIAGSFQDYLASLKGMLRKQLRKTWRLFSANEGAAFRRVSDPDEALRVLAELDRQQGARLRAQGEPYCLDQPEMSAFYQKVTAEGVADGSVILTVLTHREEVVAALLGLARRDTYVMVRIASGADRWAHCSPGRLVIAKTIETLHADGFRVFDFSVGEYPYKRWLGARSEPLYDLTVALTPLGLPLAAFDRAKHLLRQFPALHALVRRLKRKRVASE